MMFAALFRGFFTGGKVLCDCNQITTLLVKALICSKKINGTDSYFKRALTAWKNNFLMS